MSNVRPLKATRAVREPGKRMRSRLLDAAVMLFKALALAGVAVALDVAAGNCRNVRIAAFGVQATAVRLSAAEQRLEGRPAQAAAFEEAGRAGAAALDEPMSCVHASADYRRHLVATLGARALAEAVARQD